MRRQPDSGVAQAVASVKEHQKFKKMLMFGLRSLSDFCNPQLQISAENARDALERNVLPSMVTALTNFGDDEDIIFSCGQILQAMARACKDEPENKELPTKFIKEGGVTSIELILNQCPQDETVLEHCYKVIECFGSMKWLPDGGVGLLATICRSVQAVNPMPVTVARRALICLADISASPKGPAKVKEQGAMNVILQLCIALPLEQPSFGLVETVLKSALAVAEAKALDDSCLDNVIQVIEKFKSSKMALHRGSEILKCIVKLATLQKSLADIQKFPPGSAEHKSAVSTLRSLSYISTVGEQLAKDGALGIIIDLIKNSTAQMGEHADHVVDVISGAARILRTAVNNPNYCKEVLKKGGVACLLEAMQACMNYPACISSIGDALALLVQAGPEPFLASNAIDIALPILYQLGDKEDAANALVNFLLCASQHSELQPAFLANKVVEVLCTCCQYHFENPIYHMNIIQMLNRFSSHVTDLAVVYEYGGLQGIAASLSAHKADGKYCLETMHLLLTFACTPDAQKYMNAGDISIVDIILEILLDQKEDAPIIGLAVRVLEILATEDDVKRNTTNLTRALNNAKDTVDVAYSRLAAITGLYRIVRLRQSIVSSGISKQIMRSVGEWIEGKPFDGRSKLTKAAMQTTVVASDDINECKEMIIMVSDLASMGQVKRIIELEDTEDNFLTHCTNALCMLCSAEYNYTPEQCVEIMEAINKVMRKHVDSKNAETRCIEALHHLLQVTGRDGMDCLLSTGTLVGVVGYMSKIPMYLPCQIVGVGFLLDCAKMDLRAVECLKQCNCYQLLRMLNRTHTKSRKLKSMVGVLLAMLMPPDSFDAELTQLLADLENGMTGNDILSVHTALSSINQLLVAKQCIRIAVRHNVDAALEKAAAWSLANKALADKVQVSEPGELQGKDLVDTILFEVAQGLFNMGQNRCGLIHLTKHNAQLTSLKVFENLKPPVTSIVEDAACAALDSVTQMFLHDRVNVEEALKNDMLSKLCKSFTAYSACPAVIRSLCRCLAAMCITPARVQKLVESSDFIALSKALVGMVKDGDSPTKVSALKAIAELLKIRSEPLLGHFSKKTDLVASLLEIIEMRPEDSKLIEMAALCLCHFGEGVLNGRKDVPAVLANITKAVSVNKNVAATVCPLLNLLVNVANNDTKPLMKSCGVMEVVSDVMMVHLDDEEITAAGGKLFAFLGAEAQIRALMRNVIDTVAARPDNMGQQVDSMCIRIAMYLLSPLENRSDALADTEEFLGAVNTCMAYAADNKNLIANTTLVSRRLGDSAFDDSEDQFGAWAIANSGNVQQIIAVLNSDYGESNVKFICHAYRVFTACAVNTYVTDMMQSEAPNFMPRTLHLLDRYKANDDVIHAILEFLAYLAKSPATELSPHHEGSKHIIANCKKQNADIVAIACDLMVSHRQNDNVVIPAMQLIGELAASGHLKMEKEEAKTVLTSAERVCTGDATQQRRLAYMKLIEQVIAFADPGEANRHIENIIQLLGSGVIERKSPEVLTSYARLMAAACLNAEMVQELHKMGALKMMLELLDEKALMDKESFNAAIGALQASIAARPASTVPLLKEAVPKLIENGMHLIMNEPECTNAFLQLLLDALNTEGVGRTLDTIEPLMSLLQKLQAKAKEEGNKELDAKVIQILKGIANDQPKVRNCQSIYLALDERKNEGKTIIITQEMELTDDANFLLKTMATYGEKVLAHDAEDGRDHAYGSMAFELLYGEPQNCDFLIDGGVIDIHLEALDKQTHVNITNVVAAAVCAGCKTPAFVAKLLKKSGSVATMGKYLKRLHSGKGVIVPRSADETENVVELVLINALLMIERTAINRRIFLNSDVIHTVVDIWNAYDEKTYTMTRLLRQIFRTLRKIVAEGHIELMLNCNMVARIKKILAESADNTLIPDALFLAGSMAVIKQIKAQICDLGLLDGVVDLMQRHIGKMDSPNAIMTNACLALANACIGNKQATDRFLQLKGPELNVRILRDYSTVYEVTNGASILLCNMLYKNDSLKDLYGKLNAPQALVVCLKAYAGSNEPFAIRCIESLFKAISNLALYARNVVIFLDANIEESFRAWLNDLDPSFSDVQLKIGLQTLSNLVMDNKEGNMQKFSVLLTPVMKVLAQDRQDSKVSLLLFDILSSLCRLPENSEAFLRQGGVELVLSTMRRISYDAVTMTLGIHLLATQTGTPEGVQKLIEQDLFSLLLANLELEEYTAELSDILIATLRCLRKLVTTPEMVYLFCSQDGLKTCINVCKKTQHQPAVLIECLRLILGMLALTEDPEGETPAWDNIGMENEDITALLTVVCCCGNTESSHKMARLQKILLSIVGYFLSQGLGCEVLVVNNFSRAMEAILQNFPNNLEMIVLATTVLENVFTVPVDVRNNVVPKDVVKKYRDVASGLPNKKLDDKTFYSRCQALVTALASTKEEKLESTGRFNFELSDWNVDPYPNGIHDLPETAKTALRAGGRVKGYLRDNPVRVGVKWKSSQDLNFLEWGPEDEEFPYRVSIRRIRNIARGIKHPILEAANAKEPRKVTNNNCFFILGSATEDFPEGVVLPVKCKNVKERDSIVDLLVQWRDAATYNY